METLVFHYVLITVVVFVWNIVDISKTEVVHIPSGYVGCLEDNPNRILANKLNNLGKNTGENCKRRCQVEGYRYAGTEVGRECYCGNCLQSHNVTSDVECNDKCSGNRQEFCGGSRRLSLYDTSPCGLKPCTDGKNCFKIFNDSPKKYLCNCTESWKGEFCNKVVDECINKPCIDGATCQDKIDGFSCMCGPGSTGKTCFNEKGHSKADVIMCSSSTTKPPPSTTISPPSTTGSTTSTTRSPPSFTKPTPSTTRFPPSATRSPPSTTKPTLTTTRSPQSSIIPSPSTTRSPQSISIPTPSTTISPLPTTTLSTTSSPPSTTTPTPSARLPLSTTMPSQSITILSPFTTRPPETSVTSHNHVSTNWMTINNTQFLVVETKKNYSDASTHCLNMSSQLQSYTNPLRYNLLSSLIGLENRFYWIGVYMDSLGNECSTLAKKGADVRIQLEPCNNTNAFICSRIVNISNVIQDPEFVEMIKDMTVNVKKTGKAKRKLSSAEDSRRSSTFVGGTGILIICAFISLVIIADINWKRCNCASKKRPRPKI